MALIGLADAARFTGRSKQTIWRYTRAGKLSVQREPNQPPRYDTAELLRVFPAKPDAAPLPEAPAVNADLVDELRQRIAAIEADKVALRADLDRERGINDKLLATIERLQLTDQRTKTTSSSSTTPRPKRSKPTPKPAPLVQPASIGDLVAAFWRGGRR